MLHFGIHENACTTAQNVLILQLLGAAPLNRCWRQSPQTPFASPNTIIWISHCVSTAAHYWPNCRLVPCLHSYLRTLRYFRPTERMYPQSAATPSTLYSGAVMVIVSQRYRPLYWWSRCSNRPGMCLGRVPVCALVITFELHEVIFNADIIFVILIQLVAS